MDEGSAVVAVLGLSLTADEVVWALVDHTDGTLLDHDALAVDSGRCAAGAAARSARTIARCGGCDVDTARLTWTDDMADRGRTLLDTLADLGFDHVEAVPLSCALAAPVAAGALDMAPRLAVAYGAARAEVQPGEALTEPIAHLGRPRRAAGRTAAMVLGAAAAAAAAAVFVMGSANPQVAPSATAAEPAAAPDAGWVTVVAPPVAGAPAPHIVAVPSQEAARTVVVPQAPRSWAPRTAPVAAEPVVAAAAPAAPAVPTAAPAAGTGTPAEASAASPLSAALPAGPAESAAPQTASAPDAVPHVVPAGQEHLPGLLGPGPLPGPADEIAIPLPGPIPTVASNTTAPTS